MCDPAAYGIWHAKPLPPCFLSSALSNSLTITTFIYMPLNCHTHHDMSFVDTIETQSLQGTAMTVAPGWALQVGLRVQPTELFIGLMGVFASYL